MEESLEGAMKYNTTILILNISLIFSFLISWYIYYKKTGRNLDIWIHNMFLFYLLPFLLIYPFSASDFNVFAVGTNNLDIILSTINKAYFITLTGFSFAFIGKFTFQKLGMSKVVNLLFYRPFVTTIGRYYAETVKNRKVSRGLACFYLLLLFVFVSFTLSQGFASNPRAFFMANPIFRPFYNLITSLFGITFGIMATRILQYNDRTDKIMLTPIAIMGFFLGVRAPLIFQIIGFGVLYIIYKRRGYIPLYKMMLFSIFVALLLVIIVSVRNDHTESSLATPGLTFAYEILYGNTFSDLRDFSWVLGYWNGIHLWGMSYISAFLSFIPSALLAFRETWGIGKITVNMLGFDPSIHPGLRPGFFGEMYLNFGILGVMLFGFCWGQVLAKVNAVVNKSAVTNDVIIGSSALTATSFISNLSNSAGFFGFYVLFFILFFLYIITKIRFDK